MPEILDNTNIQGVGHLSRALSLVILDKNFTAAYDDVVRAVTLFRGSQLIGQLARDVERVANEDPKIKAMLSPTESAAEQGGDTPQKEQKPSPAEQARQEQKQG